MAEKRRDREVMGAPPSSPGSEEAGRHGGEAGETDTAAPGLRGGPGPGPTPGLAGTLSTGMPPEGEAAKIGEDEIRTTEHIVKIRKGDKKKF